MGEGDYKKADTPFVVPIPKFCARKRLKREETKESKSEKRIEIF